MSRESPPFFQEETAPAKDRNNLSSSSHIRPPKVYTNDAERERRTAVSLFFFWGGQQNRWPIVLTSFLRCGVELRRLKKMAQGRKEVLFVRLFLVGEKRKDLSLLFCGDVIRIAYAFPFLFWRGKKCGRIGTPVFLFVCSFSNKYEINSPWSKSYCVQTRFRDWKIGGPFQIGIGCLFVDEPSLYKQTILGSKFQTTLHDNREDP